MWQTIVAHQENFLSISVCLLLRKLNPAVHTHNTRKRNEVFFVGGEKASLEHNVNMCSENERWILICLMLSVQDPLIATMRQRTLPHPKER